METPLIKISHFLGQGWKHVKFRSAAVLLKRLKTTKEQSFRKLPIKIIVLVGRAMTTPKALSEANQVLWEDRWIKRLWYLGKFILKSVFSNAHVMPAYHIESL